MVPMQTILSRRDIGRLLCALILVSPFIGMRCWAAAPSFSNVPILTSGSGEIEAHLVPNEAGGFICPYAVDLVRISVDGNELPCDVQPGSNGRATVTGSFSGLEDGRHKAIAETLGNSGAVLCSEQALFLVDTQPPELELIRPQASRIQQTETSFQVRCRDNGSGISTDPEAAGLSVLINGSEAEWRWSEEDGDLILIIWYPTPRWDPVKSVSLSVHIQDRAGNPTEWSHSFQVEELEEEWDLESMDCDPDQYGQESRYFLQRMSLPLHASIHFIAFGPSNRSVILPLELSTFQESGTMDRSIYNAIKIVSNHPCIRVARLPRSSESAKIRFRVSQIRICEGSDCQGSITIQYPEFVAMDYDLICRDGEVHGDNWETRPQGTLKSYTVPVSLYTRAGISEEYEIKDGLLRYRFLMQGSGNLNKAPSWFEMDGMHQWLTQTAPGVYEASVPVNEGLHVYTAQLCLGLWERESVSQGNVSEDGHCLLKTDDVFVTLDPPRIDHFHYDREDECFRAMVSDQGTALEDLVLELNVSGMGGQDPGFNPETGAVLCPYPVPEGVQAARLKVTDLAGQTTMASCRIFGTTPEAVTVQTQDPAYPVTVKEGERSEARKSSSYSSNGRISRQYLEAYKGGKQAVTKCIHSRVITKEDPLTRCIKRAWALYGTTTLSQAERECSMKATGITLPAPNPALTQAEKACKEKYPPNLQYHWESEDIEECSTVWVDTLPPRIQNLNFLPGTKQVTALIDDHGMPLSQVQVSYAVAPKPLIQPNYFPGRPFSFDTGTGLFLGETSLPKETELFKVKIKATDAAGNSSRKWLDVTAPVRPPDVSLDILKKGVAAYPLGICSDHSGIDHRKTRAWLDEKSFPPFGIQYNHPSSPDQVNFAPVTEEGPHRVRLEVTDYAGLSSEASADFQVDIPPEIQDFKYLPTPLQNGGGPVFSALIRDHGDDLDLRGIELTLDGDPLDRQRLFYDPSSGYFAADGPLELTPGKHLARLTATDAHNHSDEAVLRFSPGQPIDVPDEASGDLSIEDLTLWEIEDHNGDGKANPGETVRLFVSLIQQGAEVLTSVSGRLASEEPGIAVEKDQVVYGTLNPGETLSPIHGFDIRIDEDFLDTRPSDPYEARFTLEATAESGKTWLLDLGLPVYRPTLPFSIASPEGQDAETNPLLSEITVTLDPLPSHTEQEEIEVTGSAASSASTIDEVLVRVTGTEHEALWNPGEGTFSATIPLDLGHNVIEAEAVDRSGALGMDTGFVQRSDPFVPPEIQITDPIEWEYGCWAPDDLHGVFDAGSSGVATFQGAMTAEGETVSIPVVEVIEDGEERNEGTFTTPNPLHEYFRPNWGQGHVTAITLTVILTTMDGDTVQDRVNFTHACIH